MPKLAKYSLAVFSRVRCRIEGRRRTICHLPENRVRYFRDLFVLRRVADDGIFARRAEETIMAGTRRVRSTTGRLHARRVQPVVTPAEIVRGITVTVTGRELAVRLTDRIRWHRERGDALVLQMKKLLEVEREAGEDLAEAMFGRYDSPRAALDRKRQEHQARASLLTFIRDHLTIERTYSLDSADLRITEILTD